MTDVEQMMCELQGELFELSIDNFSCSSDYFISKFMQSNLARNLDDVDNPYNFLSPHNCIAFLKNDYPSLSQKQGEQYPKYVLHWIGYVYRAISIIKKRTSIMIYRQLKTSELYSLYNSYHTMSIEYCVDRIEESLIEKYGKPKSHYEIFKSIYQKKHYIK